LLLSLTQSFLPLSLLHSSVYIVDDDDDDDDNGDDVKNSTFPLFGNPLIDSHCIIYGGFKIVFLAFHEYVKPNFFNVHIDIPRLIVD
jgi:hypothetical protein